MSSHINVSQYGGQGISHGLTKHHARVNMRRKISSNPILIKKNGVVRLR